MQVEEDGKTVTKIRHAENLMTTCATLMDCEMRPDFVGILVSRVY
jgi:hypothetical protein